MMKNIKRNKVKGFTLVELLAVIVILAIILVIAVPKVMSVIEDAKKATLESTAKMIASSAEKAKVQNTVLGNTNEITCKSVAKLNDIDYETCYIEFASNKAYVTIKGNNKFEGMYICKGTKTDSKVVNRCLNESVSITIDLDGGSANNISGIYEEGTVLDIENPIKENYIFTGWIMESGNSIISGNKLTVGSKNTVIKATWGKAYPYTVVYKTPDGIILETNTIVRTMGTTETITPPEISGYITPSSKQIRWEGEELKTIEFIYIPKGELIVTKNVEGTTTDEEFKFTITLAGDDISGNQTFSNVTFVNGVAEFTLKHGQSKRFELPANTSYKIQEEVNENYSVKFELNEESDSNISFSENTKDINKSNYIKFLNNGFKNYSTTYEKTIEKVVNQYEVTPIVVASKYVTIYKVDQYGEPVMDAELRIVDVDYGEFSAQWNTSDYPDGYNAKIGPDISLDSLVLEEISAPDGYRLSEPISLSQSISSYVMREELVLYMVDEKTFIDGVITHNDVQTITVTNTYKE